MTLLHSLLLITAANTLIMGICTSTALWLYKMQHPKSLTLCWHSTDAVLMLYWRSLDALLMLYWRSFCGVAVSTHTILPIKAANTSILAKCHSTALGLYEMQHSKSLTLCWRSVPTRAVTMLRFLWGITAANTLIMGICRSGSRGSYKMQYPKLLTLCWHSVDAV